MGEKKKKKKWTKRTERQTRREENLENVKYFTSHFIEAPCDNWQGQLQNGIKFTKTAGAAKASR